MVYSVGDEEKFLYGKRDLLGRMLHELEEVRLKERI